MYNTVTLLDTLCHCRVCCIECIQYHVYLAGFANETDLFTERQSHEIFWLDCSIKLGWVI